MKSKLLLYTGLAIRKTYVVLYSTKDYESRVHTLKIVQIDKNNTVAVDIYELHYLDNSNQDEIEMNSRTGTIKYGITPNLTFTRECVCKGKNVVMLKSKDINTPTNEDTTRFLVSLKKSSI